MNIISVFFYQYITELAVLFSFNHFLSKKVQDREEHDYDFAARPVFGEIFKSMAHRFSSAVYQFRNFFLERDNGGFNNARLGQKFAERNN